MRPRIAIRALLASALLIVLAVGVPTKLLRAADGVWSSPFDVGDDQFGWFPDVAVDYQGAVHIIWGSGIRNLRAAPGSPESTRDLLRYRVLRNGQWSAMSDIAFTCVGGYTVRNSIAAAPDGNLNVLFRSCFDVASVHAYSGAAVSASAWSNVQRLGGSYYNALAVDSKNVLHALYNEALFDSDSASPLLSEIFYRRSTDGGRTWSVRTNLARLPGGDERPQIKVDGRDRVHLVWDHGSDWYLGIDKPAYGVYRRSDDGGQTWTEAALLGVGDGPTVQNTLAVTTDGNPLVVSRSAYGTELYYQYSPDGGATWTAAQAIPGVRARDPLERGLDSYSMATDSAGKIHLLVAGFPEGSPAAIPMLLHLSWDGATWSPPEIVAATPNRPIWPRIVVSGGNTLHAVWFSYTDQSGWGDRRVWHSSKVVDAPAISPAPPPPRPTAEPPPSTTVPIATLALTSVPPVQPTAAVLTYADFSDAAPPGGLSSGPPYQTALLALAPALALISVLTLLARWWYRRNS